MNIMAILQKKDVQRFAVLALFGLLLFMIRSMLNLVLLTFLLTFLMSGLHQFAKHWIGKIIRVNSKLLLVLIYATLLTVLAMTGAKFFPELARQIAQLFELVRLTYYNPQNEVADYVKTWLDSFDISSIIKPGIDIVVKVGNLGMQIFLALLMSLLLLLGKENVIRFTAQFHTSKLGWFAKEIEFFGKKLLHTFGKVIETQLLIALINCLMSTFALWLMGFPNLIGLALLIFVLGLVPVAGVFLSLFPLSLIAYSLGGFPYVLYLILAITVIHAVEAYVLNPRLMASKTHLPVFYTFIVLLFSEHFFGIWGLIVGIPTFVFFLDILDVHKMGTPAPSSRNGA